jgi:hypothetical protein
MPTDTPELYTPSMEQIREEYSRDEHGVPTEEWAEEFNRWLTAHDREVAERAWDEAGAAFNAHFSIMGGGTTNPYRLEAGDAQ